MFTRRRRILLPPDRPQTKGTLEKPSEPCLGTPVTFWVASDKQKGNPFLISCHRHNSKRAFKVFNIFSSDNEQQAKKPTLLESNLKLVTQTSYHQLPPINFLPNKNPGGPSLSGGHEKLKLTGGPAWSRISSAELAPWSTLKPNNRKINFFSRTFQY